MYLREFDSLMLEETQNIREHLEDQIVKTHPVFGEETGEFIDFAGWASQSARVIKVDILNVKPPKIGHLNP